MSERWTIHVRESLGDSSFRFFEGDRDGWMNRCVSFARDWTPESAWGVGELKPSCERGFGRMTHHDDADEWLRRSNVELVAAEKFEEMWALARVALGKPLELVPFAVENSPPVRKPFYERLGYRFRRLVRSPFSGRGR
jgi:hypothetical protein